MWAFILKSKDQVLSFFKEFHVGRERESQVRNLRLSELTMMVNIEGNSKNTARSGKLFESNILFLRPMS